jgi:hypothetical protein
MVDYSQVNLIILDIIRNKYLDVRYFPNNLINGTKASDGYIVIIKYANSTYLPLMNSNGNHLFNNTILEVLSKRFERIVLEKFKEVISDEKDILKDRYNDNTNTDNTNTNTNTDTNEDNEFEQDNCNDILDCETVSVFFNNTIKNEPINQINHDPIIKAGEFSMAIEDMIEIEENIQDEVDIIEDVVQIPEAVPKDVFQELMNKIPTKSKLLSTKSITNTNTSTNTNTKTSPKTAITTKPLTEISNESVSNESLVVVKNEMEELKPIKKYTLIDLQIMARFHKLDTQKQGSGSKKINKTKEEMFNEIQEILERKK